MSIEELLEEIQLMFARLKEDIEAERRCRTVEAERLILRIEAALHRE